jgi:hypothetical protein
LDLLSTTRRLEREERDGERLFRTPFLNRSILFKTFEMGSGRGGPTVDGDDAGVAGTLIFLPYDAEQPGDGGEAMPYTPANFRRLRELRATASAGWANGLDEDEAILALLDSLPTLNPFLVREAFRRQGRVIAEPYLALDPVMSARLRRRLDGRVRPLVLSAFGGGSDDVAHKVEGTLDELLRQDGSSHLRELGQALGFDPESAPDALGAWAGIAFFEDELDRLKPSVHAFAHWLAHGAEPLDYVPDRRRAQLDRAVADVRSTVRARWREIRKILEAYRESYIAFAFDDDAAQFTDHLGVARQRYWNMGELFGAFEQAVHALEMYGRPYGHDKLPAQALEEFVGFLTDIFQARRRPERSTAS